MAVGDKESPVATHKTGHYPAVKMAEIPFVICIGLLLMAEHTCIMYGDRIPIFS